MVQYKYLDFLYKYQQEWSPVKRTCTEEEVEAIEKKWNVKLPRAYRELYLIQGYGAFAFHEGNDYVFNEYEQMRKDALEIAEPESRMLVEDKNIFVFALYGPSESFWFFKLDEGDDPPVYVFDESRTWYKVDESLSDCIRAQGWYQYYLKETNKKS